MLTFVPNLSWLLPEMSFKEKVQAVAKAGFSAIEFGFPSHVDLDALKYARDELGLTVVLFNQDVPIWDAANRGYLVDPARSDEFRRKLDEALEIANQLEVIKIMLPSGVEVPGIHHEALRMCMVDNLQYAANLAEQANVLLTIEVLNPNDNPGYFLTSSREAVEIVKQVDHPHVRFQFDTYHLEMMEGNLEENIKENLDWIGHIQFADYPGRHEPGTGMVDFHRLIEQIELLGYSEYIGLEYIPLSKDVETFSWIPALNRT
jgi:hydroxypyruvate isomerase